MVDGVGGEDSGFALQSNFHGGAVEPFFDEDGAKGEPGGVEGGRAVGMAVGVSVAVRGMVLEEFVGVFDKEFGIEGEDGGVACELLVLHGTQEWERHTHSKTSKQQQSGNTHTPQTLNLPVPIRKSLTRPPPRKAHRPQRQKVRHQIRQRMEGIGDQRLGVEDHASETLGDGHKEVDEESDAGDAYAGIGLIGGGEEGVRAVVVVGEGGVRVVMAVVVV